MEENYIDNVWYFVEINFYSTIISSDIMFSIYWDDWKKLEYNFV